ncbi:MAG: hypothetical protein ACOYMR_15350 [Ilumatobacteraceae bacterium]
MAIDVLDITPAGIAVHGRFGRRIAVQDVRRVHVYTDANGEQGIVVRRRLWSFVHVPKDDLRDPSIRAQVRSLVDDVRGRAKVDPEVDRFLAAA